MNFPRITPPPRLPGINVPVPIHGVHARAWAQPENCVSGFTNTDTACSALTSRVDTCASVLAADNLKPMEQNPQFASCFCGQDLFSDIVVCKGIHRQCILDYAYDSDFEKYQSQWLEFCGSVSPNLKVTTPPLPTVSVPRATNTCDYVKTACDRYSRYKDICARNYASHSINCNCQPQIQYVESICTIDGGALCATATPTISGNGELSDLWAYKSCKTWLGIPGTLAPGGLSYIRGTAATPTVTNVPFVDFPLTYFNVPTDPVFNESTTTGVMSVNPNSGTKRGFKSLALGVCLCLAAGIHLL
ncbi:hypothetical protein QBC34DRAFT_147375 [Podospora aff. communis PSN243]|uniref:Extracellular membrane protein CFEM domain-containing protein n=1 Tax=Podospora aff. communis PSN243 TaxID=3040156 RepID=A0AAV9GEY0_9PEZI|nr:hypothetical protein QBC34DRAFT_147375 [Podospora aff. communis PSN243]